MELLNTAVNAAVVGAVGLLLSLQINRRFREVDRRFEEVNRRFEQVDRRFETMEARLDAIRSDLTTVALATGGPKAEAQ